MYCNEYRSWNYCSEAMFARDAWNNRYGSLADACELKKMGVDIEAPSSHNGQISFGFNWKKIAHYDNEWNNWYASEF